MQAVIMAGGKGTRLSSVLKDIPKPMVPIMGKPLLEYQIENLRDSGVTDIMLVVGHLGSVIQDYFKDGSRLGVNISYYAEKTPLGTAGALVYLKDWIENDFILLFGDLFVNVNFQRFYDYHLEKQAFATLYVHPNSHPHDSDILVTDQDNRVIDWSYKSTVRNCDYKNLVNAGVYVLAKEILDHIPENQKTDLEKQVLVALLEKRKICAYLCTEYVKDIGTPERLKKVEADLKSGICEKRNLKHKQKCIFLDRDGTLNRHIGFLNNREQMELENTVAEAVQKINESEYLAIVVSNQPVIARGECSFEELAAIHNRMDMLLGSEGAYLDDLYYCPHHPDSGFEGEVRELKFECGCRKPKIGLLEKAALEHNIDLKESWIIGDTTIDIQTGKNGGLKTALVLTGEAGCDGKYDVLPDITGETLLECVNEIIRTGEK